jgi:cobalt-zinc-cadmium efflux system outer membrane protein
MDVSNAARGAVVVLLFAFSPASHALTLNDAMRRTERFHPELQLWSSSFSALQAESERAALKPALRLGAELENVLGSGAASGVQGAELTLSLASVLERGAKRGARQAVVQSRIDGLAISRETRRLDVLAEVARRYLDLSGAQALIRVAQLDLDQRQRTVRAAQRRVQAGAAHQSQLLAAEALVIRSEVELQGASATQMNASRRLALLWGGHANALLQVSETPLDLPPLQSFEALLTKLQQAPELQQFASEQRQREARIQLAGTQRTADIDWQLGVRRLQDGSDWGLVAGFSIPLGSAARSVPEVQMAAAELAALEPELASRELSLQATLAQAHGRYEQLAHETHELGTRLIPALQKAEQAAGRAYGAGALSYLEWAQLQSETTSAMRQQISTVLDAQRALIELQRLTGETMLDLPLAAQSTELTP